jgi:hypothetical protein
MVNALQMFVSGTIGFIPKLAVMNVFGKLASLVPGFANDVYRTAVDQQIGNPLNSFASVAGADIVMPRQQNKKARLGLSDVAFTATFAFIGGLNNMSKTKALAASIKDISDLMNPELTEFSDNEPEEIKAKMAQAGMEITDETEAAIANMKEVWKQLPEQEREKVFKGLRLRDIPEFIEMKWILSLDDSEELLKGVDNKTMMDLLGITKPESKVTRVAKAVGEIAKGTVAKVFKQPQEQKDRQTVEERKAQARARLLGTDIVFGTGKKVTKIGNVEEMLSYMMRKTARINTTSSEQEKLLRDAEERMMATIYPKADPRRWQTS